MFIYIYIYSYIFLYKNFLLIFYKHKIEFEKIKIGRIVRNVAHIDITL